MQSTLKEGRTRRPARARKKRSCLKARNSYVRFTVLVDAAFGPHFFEGSVNLSCSHVKTDAPKNSIMIVDGLMDLRTEAIVESPLVAFHRSALLETPSKGRPLGSGLARSAIIDVAEVTK